MPQLTLDVDNTVRQVRQGVGYARLAEFGIVHVAGADAAAFLQSQTTSDVFQLAEGQGQASALLDRKAHIQAYFSLHYWEGLFWVLLERAQIPQTLAHLEKYHFAEDVSFRDRSEGYTILTLQGPQSWELLAKLSQDPLPAMQAYDILTLPLPSGIPAIVIKRSLTGESGYCLCVAKERADKLESLLTTLGEPFGLVAINPEVQRILRVEAGIAQYGVDMDKDTMLPETGLERQAVSYTKGCYQGQEVVARVKTYGSVQKAMVGLIFEDNPPLPPLDSPCHVQQQPVGTIKSSVFSPTLQAPIAMAYLNREYRVPGKILDLAIADRQYRAKVVWLPFYTPMETTQKAKLRYEAGLKLFADNQEDAAIQALREALALNPLLKEAYEVLGVMLSRREEYDEAIALMKRLAELDPEEVMAHTNLSVFYMKKGMKEEAEVEKALATTLGFQKAMKEKQQQQAEVQAKAQQEQAMAEKIRMFEEVLALDPEDALANYSLGNIYVGQQRFAEAVVLLEKAIATDPKYTVAYLALGKALEGLGKADQALEIYKQGIAVAAKRGDLMPLQEMQQRQAALQDSA